jgi:hypothetical protein
VVAAENAEALNGMARIIEFFDTFVPDGYNQAPL